MRERARLLISISVVVMIIGAIFLAGKPERSSAQRGGGYRSYQLLVYCGNPQVATATFWHDVPPPSFGLLRICAGNCRKGGVTIAVTLADALAGLPSRVSTTLWQMVNAHQADAAAGKGRRLTCLGDKEPPKPKCEPPDMPPWFNSDSDCIEKHKVVVLSRAVSKTWREKDAGVWREIPGIARCEVEYRICGSRIIKQISVPTEQYPQACIQLAENASRPFVCCEKWRGAIGNSSCDPLENADCDGMINEQDEFPIDPWNQFTGATDTRNSYGIDPYIPREPCRGCKWELIGTNGICKNIEISSGFTSSDITVEFTWKCPANGKIVNTSINKGLGSPCPIYKDRVEE